MAVMEARKIGMNATQAAEGLPRRKFCRAELEAMLEAGILMEDDRFEMIGGELVVMSPKGIRHEVLKGELLRVWIRSAPQEYVIIPETTLWLDEHDFVEPDILVFRREDGLAGMNGEKALLAVEIADSSLAYDLGRKMRIYASYGMRELWVIDAQRMTVRVHRRPEGDGYRQVSDHAASERLTPELVPALSLRLDELEL